MLLKPFIARCNHGTIEASFVPESLVGPPGLCPAGLYETVLVQESRWVDWDQHWQRLVESCRQFGLEAPDFIPADFTIPREMTARVRIMVFQESLQWEEGITNWLALATEVTQINSPRPVRLGVVAKRRAIEVHYHHKRSGLISDHDAVENQKVSGFTDGLFLTEDGYICETLYANILGVKDGSIITPGQESPCLPGITARNLEKTAQARGIPFQRRAIHIDEIPSLDELWLSSSIQGIRPVHQMENVEFKSAKSNRSIMAGLLHSGFPAD